MATENSFGTLINLLVKYDSALPRDAELLKVLSNDIQKLLSASSSYSTPSQNVFLRLIDSFAYSKSYIPTIINALARCGFNRHALDSRSGLSPLQWIVTNKGDEYIYHLNALLQGCDVNKAYAKQGGSEADQFLLLTAVSGGKIGFVRALLAAGAKVDLPEIIPPVMSLAYAAAQLGRSDILKLLIEHKADTKKAFRGKTPLVLAAKGVARGGSTERCFQECVELLVPRPPAPSSAAAMGSAKRELEDVATAGSAAKRAKVAECIICSDKSAEIAFLPCGHMCICSTCVPLASKCPICRGTFTSTVKIFIP